MSKKNTGDEKAHFSSRLTNPFRRAHDGGSSETDNNHNNHSRQATDPSASSSKTPVPNQEEYRPPPGPPPGYAQYSEPQETFLPPPGPPPSAQQPTHTRPPAPDQVFQPPPGPPPSASHTGPDTQQPPGYADWMSVPDTSQLPPPPSMTYEESPTANASGLSADQAAAFTRAHPLDPPRRLLGPEVSRVAAYDINLARPPPSFSGKLSRTAPGTWLAQTNPNSQDTMLLTDLPLYSALANDRPKTVYFEIKVLRMEPVSSSAYAEADAGVAIGFVAPPYPHWRLPGWERASLGVHGDDGRRYVHNNMGGQDFTTSFKNGEVVGIGMTFGAPSSHEPRGHVEVFFTREGEKEGLWNLHEERDHDLEGGVDGLEGHRDLFGAVGFFGRVEFETRFRRDQWLYRPRG